MAGYSNKPLSEKLGIKEGMEVLLVNAPDNYPNSLKPLPGKVTFLKTPKKDLKFIQLFVRTNKELFDLFPSLKENMAKDGSMWVCWPKLSSKVITDVTENKLRDYLLEESLVDVKVIAIDNLWSGLKFVYRLKDR